MKGGTDCTSEVDADIAGQGVRSAALVQVAVLIALSLLGSFHPNATGVKEVGGGLMLTTLALAIALIVRLTSGDLSPLDAVLGAMILDGQSMALSIQLASKETLASRWQVSMVVATQLLGYGTTVAIIALFNNGGSPTAECRCVRVFWWGWLANCKEFRSTLEQSVFWLYMVCRGISMVQASFHALWNMTPFDRAQKDSRDTGDDFKKLGGTLIGITYPQYTAHGNARYGEYPATVTFMYAFYGVLSLTSLSIVEGVFRNLDLEASSGVNSPGQVIAIVIAGVSVVRACWLLFDLLTRQANTKDRGFHWPFHLGQSNLSGGRQYLRVPLGKYRPGHVQIGSLLKNPAPAGLDARYACHVPVAGTSPTIMPGQTSRSHFGATWKRFPTEEELDDIYLSGDGTDLLNEFATFPWSRPSWPRRQLLTLGRWIGAIFRSTELVECTGMEEYLLKDARRRVAELAMQSDALDEIRSDVESGKQPVTVYLVVGALVAKGLSVTWTRERKVPSQANGRTPHGNTQVGHYREHRRELGDEPFLYAYSVQEFMITRDGEVL